MAYTNPLDDLSYTNKDFQTIYPELLQLIKQLSYKWDPTISNESDPGVLLVKLNAIINDKANYVSDKNVLEAFPSTVTQLPNAYELFNTLGYEMKWYKSASTTIAMKINPEAEWDGESYTIPAYSTFSDDENSVVYSTLAEVSVNSVDEAITCPAMEGIPTTYKIGDSETVTIADLDSNRRVYLTDYNVAQNSIVISNISNEESIAQQIQWKQVENLNIQPRGQKTFKFGLSAELNMCYVEFPSDIATLIEDGITITYLKSAGKEGNIPVQAISQFYETPVLKDGTTIDTSLILVTNATSGTGGEDPEDIDSGYLHYKETIGVFETLVSLRDYLDYILSHNLAGNAFVTDRTNDIQSSYDILVEEGGLYAPKHIIKEDANSEDEMNAFDLKITALKYLPSNSIKTKNSYNESFELQDYFDDEHKDTTLIDALQDTKSIQHDFAYLNPLYNVDNSKYTQESQTITFAESTNTITLTLEHTPISISNNLKDLNFNNLETDCEDIALSVTGNTITASEIAGNNIKLTLGTSATSFNVEEFDYYSLPDPKVLFYKNYYPINCKVYPTTHLSDKQVKEVQENIRQAMYQLLCSNNVSFGNQVSWEEISNTLKTADDRIKNVILEDISYETKAVFYLNQDSTPIVYEYPINEKIENPATTKDIIIEEIRNSIEAKSILAGITPFLDYKNSFEVDITQSQPSSNSIMTNVSNIATNFTKFSEITAKPIQGSTNYENTTSFTLQDNENLIISKPIYKEELQYGLGIKYQTNITDSSKDTPYLLTGNDYIIFFWRKEDSNNAPYYYSLYTAGATIKPNFTITHNFDGRYFTSDSYNSYFSSQYKDVRIPNYANFNDSNTNINSWINETLLPSKYNLSSSTTITILNKNANELPSSAVNFYWVTHNIVDDKYVLFNPYKQDTSQSPEEGTSPSNKYILKDGEYFVYSDKNKQEFVILGPGTLLERVYKGDGIYDALYCDINKDLDIQNISDPTSLNWVNKDSEALSNITFKYEIRDLLVLPPKTSIDIVWREGNYNSYYFYFSNDNYKILYLRSDQTPQIQPNPADLTLQYRLEEASNDVQFAINSGESDFYIYGSLNINSSTSNPQALPLYDSSSSIGTYVLSNNSSTLLGIPFSGEQRSEGSSITISLPTNNTKINRLWGWAILPPEYSSHAVCHFELFNDNNLYDYDDNNSSYEQLGSITCENNTLSINWGTQEESFSITKAIFFGNYNTSFGESGSPFADRTSTIKVQFSPELNIPGSNNTDLVQLNQLSGLSGASSYYIYVQTNQDDDITISAPTPPATTKSETISTTLYGNLFMKVHFTGGSATFKPYSGASDAQDYFTRETTMRVNQNETKDYYFMFPSRGTNPTISDGTFTAGAQGASLRIDSILMLTDEAVARTNSDLLKHLVELDASREFNYLYIPDDTIKIDNPLEAKSFFNNNHIFKAFTIPQMDTQSLFGDTNNTRPIVVNE